MLLKNKTQTLSSSLFLEHKIRLMLENKWQLARERYKTWATNTFALNRLGTTMALSTAQQIIGTVDRILICTEKEFQKRVGWRLHYVELHHAQKVQKYLKRLKNRTSSYVADEVHAILLLSLCHRSRVAQPPPPPGTCLCDRSAHPQAKNKLIPNQQNGVKVRKI